MSIFYKSILAIISVIFIGSFVTNCATVPTGQDLATADYGNQPSNAEEIITAYLKEALKDPDSLKNLKVGIPKRGWATANYGKDTIYGYWVGYSYNAKNTYGGYVGQKYYCAFFRRGYIEQTWPEGDCSLFAHPIE